MGRWERIALDCSFDCALELALAVAVALAVSLAHALDVAVPVDIAVAHTVANILALALALSLARILAHTDAQSHSVSGAPQLSLDRTSNPLVNVMSREHQDSMHHVTESQKYNLHCTECLVPAPSLNLFRVSSNLLV